MTLYMKEKVFSWNAAFSIFDENENVVYTVEGEIFSWGRKLHVYDQNKIEVAFVWQKLMTFMPRYNIEIGGTQVASLHQRFTLFSHDFDLEGPNWTLSGDFFAHDFVMTNGGDTIMRLSKQWFTWGDSFCLEIPDPQHALLCLCVCLAIDAVLDSHNSSST